MLGGERERASLSLLDEDTVVILVDIAATLMKGERWLGQPLAAYLARLAERMNRSGNGAAAPLRVWLVEYHIGSAATPILKYYCRLESFSVSEAECHW